MRPLLIINMSHTILFTIFIGQHFQQHMTKQKPSQQYIDAHVHLVDFMQETEGLRSLIQAMDRANVKKSVVCGIPLKKKWEYFEPQKPQYILENNSPCYYFSGTDEILAHEYQNLPKHQQQRIAPLLCGFNPTDVSAIDYVKNMFIKYPFWKGIGEIFFRHGNITNLTEGETPRVNHPAILPLFKFCEENNIPVLVHQNITALGDKKEQRYLHEFTETLERDTRTTRKQKH